LGCHKHILKTYFTDFSSAVFQGGLFGGILMSCFNLLMLLDAVQAALKWLPKPRPRPAKVAKAGPRKNQEMSPKNAEKRLQCSWEKWRNHDDQPAQCVFFSKNSDWVCKDAEPCQFWANMFCSSSWVFDQ